MWLNSTVEMISAGSIKTKMNAERERRREGDVQYESGNDSERERSSH